MSEQHIGRKRSFNVIDADGNEETTTVQTVGLQKKKSRPTPRPAPDPSAESPVPEPPAEVSENGDARAEEPHSEG